MTGAVNKVEETVSRVEDNIENVKDSLKAMGNRVISHTCESEEKIELFKNSLGIKVDANATSIKKVASLVLKSAAALDSKIDANAADMKKVADLIIKSEEKSDNEGKALDSKIDTNDVNKKDLSDLQEKLLMENSANEALHSRNYEELWKVVNSLVSD